MSTDPDKKKHLYETGAGTMKGGVRAVATADIAKQSWGPLFLALNKAYTTETERLVEDGNGVDVASVVVSAMANLLITILTDVANTISLNADRNPHEVIEDTAAVIMSGATYAGHMLFKRQEPSRGEWTTADLNDPGSYAADLASKLMRVHRTMKTSHLEGRVVDVGAAVAEILTGATRFASEALVDASMIAELTGARPAEEQLALNLRTMQETITSTAPELLQERREADARERAMAEAPPMEKRN